MLLLLVVVIALNTSAKAKSWPAIKPTFWSGTMDLLGPPTVIVIPTTTAKVTYRLYCSTRLAAPEPEWLTGGDSYGGDFECLLTDTTPGVNATRATLLNYDAEDSSPYHFNLGSFDWSAIVGTCRNDRQWGSDRAFTLRGMKLRIRVTDFKVESYNDPKQKATYPIIRWVTAEISAKPDAAAHNSLARPPRYNEPKRCMDE